MNDFIIFANGVQIEQFTDANLTRNKGEMTGTLNFSLFCSYVPGQPIMTQALQGAEITAYIGGHLAFVGSVDRRRGTGSSAGAPGTKNAPPSSGSGESSVSGSVNIGPTEYTVQITARGKTKQLIDSSHKHPTGTILRPSTRQVVDALVEGTDVEIEWLATDIKLDKVRFRDGAIIADELHRVGNENAYFLYETRDGNLRITDDTGRAIGDPLVLGENILQFSAEQGEDIEREEIRVKGQRTPNEVWGEAAVLGTEKTISVSNSAPSSGAGRPNKAVVTLQHYGDGTPEALERRAQFEANKRASASKSVNIEVFGVQSTGEPWDIGNVHYVEVPPEGIFTAMECTGLSYVVNATDTLKTVLTLSPLPAGGVSGGTSPTGFDLPGLDDLVSFGASRRGEKLAGVEFAASWDGPILAISNPVTSAFTLTNQLDRLKGLAKDDGRQKPPKTLPASFGSPRR